MKACTKCGEEKALSAYYKKKRASGTYGVNAACKECVKAAALKYRNENLEAVRAHAREYARAHKEEARLRFDRWVAKNREHKRAYDKRWKEENSEHLAEYFRANAEANPERVRKNKRAYAKRHPERIREKVWQQSQKRRGDKPSRETYGYRKVLLNDPCSYCGGPAAETDHIIPRNDWSTSVAGWNDWNNLTASCLSCNRKKHAKSLLTFLTG